jgi:hypothetical protein
VWIDSHFALQWWRCGLQCMYVAIRVHPVERAGSAHKRLCRADLYMCNQCAVATMHGMLPLLRPLSSGSIQASCCCASPG